jgi:hypothetical protein
MAATDNPENKKPTAAPGRMACEIASPLKLILFNVKKTPIRGALKQRHISDTEAFCIKSYESSGCIR